jgi:hypothetical protein
MVLYAKILKYCATVPATILFHSASVIAVVCSNMKKILKYAAGMF